MERPWSENTRIGCAPSGLIGGLWVDPQQRHELVTILQKMTTVGDFNLAAIDLLKARYQGKQNRFWLLRTGAEHQQWRHVLVGCPAVIELSFIGAHDRRDASQRLGNAIRIDDHDHRSVAEYCGSGKSRDVPELRRHRLNDDLLGVQYAVDDDAENLAADLSNDDEALVGLAAVELQRFP